MEARIRNFLLAIICAITLSHIPSLEAAEAANQDVKAVIQPEIERMTFKESRINPDNFEIVTSFGLMSIENFGTNISYNLKLAYRISEGFFIETEYGTSSAGKTSAETLFPGAPLLSDDERELKYYLLNIGYDIFPGEAFVTKNTTYNTAFYLIAGIGNTKFAGSDNFTLSVGYGYRVIFGDHITTYLDIRDHTYKIDIFGEDKLTNNLALNFGLGFYF